MNKRSVLIAGFGSAGRRHFHNLAALGCSQFIFYRSDQSTLDTTEIKEYPTFTDLEEALELKPDVVVIANPTSLHLSVAIPAARAGCDLFIEKPVSHDLTGRGELKSLVENKKLITMVGCQYRFHPLLVSLRNQVQAGRIGTVVSARAEYGEYLPGWHPWEDHRRSYTARTELGGGVILTLIHPLDYLYWLFGPVTRTHASTVRIPSLKTNTEDDLAEITLEFHSGIIGQVHLDYWQQPPVHTLRVWGERGSAQLDFLSGILKWEFHEGRRESESVPSGYDRNSMFLDEMKHFFGCVERRESSSIPLNDGIAVLEIALSAKQDALQRKNATVH